MKNSFTGISNPVYIRHFVTLAAFHPGERPDMKLVAEQFAKYILENGLIESHEPRMTLGSPTGYEYTFTMGTLQYNRGLP